jgi:hypothetical protein
MATAVAERVEAVVSRKLADACEQLRTLVADLVGRERFLSDAITLLKERLDAYRHADAALDAALRGDKIDNVEAALVSLERAPDCSAVVERYLALLNHRRTMRDAKESFFNAHPEAREVLTTVCSLRVDEARANLKKSTEEEQRRLDSLGADYDATTSPVVKRVAAKVGHLEGMLRRVEQDRELGNFFDNFARELL